MSNELKMRRVTLVLRNDLNDRVIERAEELGQNPNNFVICAWKAAWRR